MAGRLSILSRFGQGFMRLRCERVGLRNLQHLRNLKTCTPLSAVTNLTMPALSPTMEEGTIIKWHKKEGDVINPGDSVCEIQTDKAVLTLDVEDEGILAKIIMPDNSKNVRVGSIIGLIVDEGDDWQNVTVPAAADSASPPAPLPPIPAPAAAPASPSPALSSPASPAPLKKSGVTMGYGPAVRSLLDIYQISLDDVQGTGPHGRHLKGDLLRYINEKSLKPVAVGTVALPVRTESQKGTSPGPAAVTAPAAFNSEGYTDHDLSNIRKVIAKRLTESKTTIPHSYASVECHIDKVLIIRKELIDEGIKVSVNDFIVKAAGVALERVPEVNANMDTGGVRLLENVDISVAVATENGLITPIIKHASTLGVAEISDSIKELAGRARKGKLKPNEFQGGSFTISNLGMFGISEFSAVINPPQACIMAVGTSRLRPGINNNLRPETWMTVTLSSDVRIVDDLLAAQFLATFREIIENPILMIGSAKTKKIQVNDGEEQIVIDKAKLFSSWEL